MGDIYNKRLEDPLANIRRNEKSMKERLLANPVKMKAMRKFFEEMLEEKLKAKAAKAKKQSKKPKKRKVESSDSDSSVEADEQLEKARLESQGQLSRHKGTSKTWNQYERFRSSYVSRLVNRDVDDNTQISSSKGTSISRPE